VLNNWVKAPGVACPEAYTGAAGVPTGRNGRGFSSSGCEFGGPASELGALPEKPCSSAVKPPVPSEGAAPGVGARRSGRFSGWALKSSVLCRTNAVNPDSGLVERASELATVRWTSSGCLAAEGGKTSPLKARSNWVNPSLDCPGGDPDAGTGVGS